MRILITMLATNVVLLLLPAIVYSKISINIKPGKTKDESSVSFSGEDVAEISEKERKTFKLDDETLKNVVKKYKGRRPNDVYLNQPTRFGNVYDKYGWEGVKRYLRPIDARVIGVNSKPVAVSTAEYVNNHDTIAAVYSTAVTQTVEETVSHSWSTGGELTVGQEINYEVNFGAAKVGGTTSLSYSANWGEEKTKSRSVVLGTTSTIQTSVPPGATVLATITATQGTMDIEIEYMSTLNNGDVFCNFEDTLEGHHFWAYSLRTLQGHGNLPSRFYHTEKLRIGFYSNAKMIITNGTTDALIDEGPVGLVGVGDETYN